MLTLSQLDALQNARNLAFDAQEDMDENDLETTVNTDDLETIINAFLFLFNFVESTGSLAQFSPRK